MDKPCEFNQLKIYFQDNLLKNHDSKDVTTALVPFISFYCRRSDRPNSKIDLKNSLCQDLNCFPVVQMTNMLANSAMLPPNLN
jgi:hypothetical protein